VRVALTYFELRGNGGEERCWGESSPSIPNPGVLEEVSLTRGLISNGGNGVQAWIFVSAPICLCGSPKNLYVVSFVINALFLQNLLLRGLMGTKIIRGPGGMSLK